MSLFSAMTVAVGGLEAQSDSIGNISDNIANAQTVGFKAIDTSFESLVTQSNSNVNDPGGVRATPVYQNAVQGTVNSTQTATNLAISGNGFFDVSLPVSTASGGVSFTGQDYYTRRGDFTLDTNGYMVNGAGYVLNGYTVDSAGNVNTSATTPIQISALLDNPVATSTITYAANLPASATTNTTFSNSTVQIYDQVGAKHNVTLAWSKGQPSEAPNTWYLALTPTDAVNSSGTALGTQYLKFVFNSSGTAAGTLSSITEVSGIPAANTPAAIAAADAAPTNPVFTIPPSTAPNYTASVSLGLDYPGAGTQTTAINFGQYGLASGLTQFDGTSLSVSSLQQNGIPQGSFQSLAVGSNGDVTLNYNNGASRTLYQIPLVQFNSPDNLNNVNGEAFQQTLASGTPQLNLPGNAAAGTIVGSSLEASTVDIATEFTTMIQAQRIYSANSKTITTVDSMLQDVIDIIR